MIASIGTRVKIIDAGSDTGRTGEVVAGTMWTANETDPGDRVVRMDDNGERLVFQAWMITEAPVEITRTTATLATATLAMTSITARDAAEYLRRVYAGEPINRERAAHLASMLDRVAQDAGTDRDRIRTETA